MNFRGVRRCHFAFSPDDFFGLALGYLCGSIPFGLLLTRFAGTADLRSIGSGNIGATNVLRTGRKDLAAATLVLDALKGTAAVLIAYSYLGAEAVARRRDRRLSGPSLSRLDRAFAAARASRRFLAA